MDTSQYTHYRPLMFSIAYRMTGSVSDAEDIVQEAFLRAAKDGGKDAEVESPKAYLATITTRLAIDHLRSARVRRESYIGTWLPEPLLGGAPVGPRSSGGEADPAELIDEINDEKPQRVLLVGHEPDLSALISTLICGKRNADIELKKGGLAKLTAETLTYGKCATLNWLLTPKQLRQLG